MRFPYLSQITQISFVLAVILSSAVFADTITWTGTTSSDWNTASNWSTAAVPTATDDVIIIKGVPNLPTINADYSVKTLTLKTDADTTFKSMAAGYYAAEDFKAYTCVVSGATTTYADFTGYLNAGSTKGISTTTDATGTRYFNNSVSSNASNIFYYISNKLKDNNGVEYTTSKTVLSNEPTMGDVIVNKDYFLRPTDYAYFSDGKKYHMFESKIVANGSRVMVSSATTVPLDQQTTYAYRDLVLAGGSLTDGNYPCIVSGNITLQSNSAIDMADGARKRTITLNDVVMKSTDSAAILTIKDNASYLGTLAVQNSDFSGFNGSTIQLGDSAAPAGAVVLGSGVTGTDKVNWKFVATTAGKCYIENSVAGTFKLGAIESAVSNAEIRAGVAGATTYEIGGLNKDSSYAGKITNGSGTVSINKTGTGTLTLSSASNTYTGGTTITEGRIIATNASALGSGAVTNNSELEFNLASDGTCSNVISGSGQLYKTGTGTLTTNKAGWSYTGGITISEGVMKFGVHDTFGQAAATPSVTINVNGGTLASNNTFTTLMDVNLAGGTINSDGGANGTYGAFQIKGAITVSGDKPSYITQTAGKNNNGLHIFNNTINVADVADGDDLIVSATLRNAPDGTAKGFTKTGAGTMRLDVANTYSGATTVSAGTLDLANTNAAGTGAITLGDANTAAQNVTLKLSATNIANNLTVTNAGTGTVTLYGNSQFTYYKGTITLNRDTYFEIPQNGTNDWWYCFDNTITGSGDIIVKGGSGTSYDPGHNRIWFSKDNSALTGDFIVQSGAAQLSNSKAAGSGTIYIGNANSDTETVRLILGANTNNNIVISADTPITSTPVIASYNGTQEINSPIVFNRSATLYGSTGRLTFKGVWSGDGDITIDGKRVTHDTVANTWTGDMVIKSGATFQPGHAQTLSAANAVEVNGTLQLNGVNQTIGTLSGAGTIKNEVGANTLTVNQATDSTFSGTLIDGSSVLTFIKDGTGTLTLSAANTYTGATTVSAGTLKLDVADAIESSSSVINNAAITFKGNQTLKNLSSDTTAGTRSVSGTGVLTLDNNKDTQFVGNIEADSISFIGSENIKINGTLKGSITFSGTPEINLLGTLKSGDLIIPSGSTFSPGNSIGNFTLEGGNFTLESGATHSVELGGDPLDWDKLFVTGAVTLEEGSFLKIALDGVTLDEQQKYELISSTDAITNAVTLLDLPGWELAVLTSGDEGYTNGLFLQKASEASVPEPSSWALLILGALGLWGLRRRK